VALVCSFFVLFWWRYFGIVLLLYSTADTQEETDVFLQTGSLKYVLRKMQHVKEIKLELKLQFI